MVNKNAMTMEKLFNIITETCTKKQAKIILEAVADFKREEEQNIYARLNFDYVMKAKKIIDEVEKQFGIVKNG